MVWFSYHGGHSGQFCGHAKGKLEDVVKTAIERGFTHYGLSEHCPRDRVADLYPEEQAAGVDGLATKFDAYLREARRVQALYADHIDVLVGFETERLPPQQWAERMTALRRHTQADFIIGSVHDVDGTWVDLSPEMTAEAARAAGGREALQIKYFDAVAELVTTLRPEVVGHIDLVRKFDGETAHFGPRAMAACERALEAASAVGAVLDVNPGAMRRGMSPVYPLPQILARAREMGVGVTLGDDGHGPHDVGAGLEACMEAIAGAGYQVVDYFAHEAGAVVRRQAPLGDVGPDAGRLP